MGTRMSGQLEHFVFVALPETDPTLGFYSRNKYQGAHLVKINKRKCIANQQALADVGDYMSL